MTQAIVTLVVVVGIAAGLYFGFPYYCKPLNICDAFGGGGDSTVEDMLNLAKSKGDEATSLVSSRGEMYKKFGDDVTNAMKKGDADFFKRRGGTGQIHINTAAETPTTADLQRYASIRKANFATISHTRLSMN